MLRPRPDGSVELDVQVVPRASKSAIGRPHGDRLKIHVTAPPVDGEANAALLELLRQTLGLPRDALALLRGQTGKRKTIRITGLALEDLRSKLRVDDAC